VLARLAVSDATEGRQPPGNHAAHEVPVAFCPLETTVVDYDCLDGGPMAARPSSTSSSAHLARNPD
jgi:hypothetical protein